MILTIFYIVSRFCLILGAYEISFWLRQNLLSSYLTGISQFEGYTLFFGFSCVIIGFYAYLEGWFSLAWFRQSLRIRLAKTAKIFLYALILLAITAFFLQLHLFSRTFLLMFILISFGLETLLDILVGKAGSRVRKILCIGPPELVKNLGLWCRERNLNLLFLQSESSLVKIDHIERALLKYEPDEIIFLSWNLAPKSTISSLTAFIKAHGLRTLVRDLSVLTRIFPKRKQFSRYDRYLREVFCEPGPKDLSARWKRLFDLTIVLIFSPVLAMLFILIFGILKIVNGQAIFRQERIGYMGRIFFIYKFRTLLEEVHGGKPNTDADKNLLPLGWLLRRTSLDELPQFLNVLKGDMSLVGPRPEMVSIVEAKYSSFHFKRVLIKPGLTGLWQIQGRRQPIHDHLKYDFFYLHNQNFWLDLLILLRTLPAVILCRGAR